METSTTGTNIYWVLRYMEKKLIIRELTSSLLYLYLSRTCLLWLARFSGSFNIPVIAFSCCLLFPARFSGSFNISVIACSCCFLYSARFSGSFNLSVIAFSCCLSCSARFLRSFNFCNSFWLLFIMLSTFLRFRQTLIHIFYLLFIMVSTLSGSFNFSVIASSNCLLCSARFSCSFKLFLMSCYLFSLCFTRKSES